MQAYSDFFRAATGNEPYPYQVRMAESGLWPTLARIPTGLGKTEATVLAWMWRLLELADAPRRLVYVLPLRTLVDQTVQRVDDWRERLEAHYGEKLPLVEKLLGGEVGDDWIGNPDKPYVIVGTQDLILSRALNRGYAMGRRKWPMAFGLLHNDCVWVVDEVQLQGIGAMTAAQLQGDRKSVV